MILSQLLQAIHKSSFNFFHLSNKWQNFMMSIFIGITIGLCVSIFTVFLRIMEKGVHLVLKTDFENFIHSPRITTGDWFQQVSLILILLLVGGLVSGVFNKYFKTYQGLKINQFGTDAVIGAFNGYEKHLSSLSAILKTLIASPILIAVGGSAGLEGTVAYLGGGVGALYTKIFPQLKKNRRMFIICGASASIGAVFHAPLGASIYMAEVLYFSSELDTSYVAHSIISSVIAYAVFIIFFGHHALFDFHNITFHPSDIYYAMILALLVTPISLLFSKILNVTIDTFEDLQIPIYLKPVGGCLLLGVILIIFPYAGGVGYNYIQKLIEGNIAILLIPLFIVFKILATSLTVGSGGNGGLFGPSVVIGAFIGSGYAMILQQMGIPLNNETYIVIGMSAFLSATENTPISSVIMITEITGTYELLIPLSLASVTSFFLGKKAVLYRSQVDSRIDSSAYQGKYLDMDQLKQVRAKDIIFLTADKMPRIYLHENIEVILEKASRNVMVQLYPVYAKNDELKGFIDAHLLRKDIQTGIISTDLFPLIIAQDLYSVEYNYIDGDSIVYDIISLFINVDDNLAELENYPVIGQEGEFIGVLRSVDIMHKQFKLFDTLIGK